MSTLGGKLLNNSKSGPLGPISLIMDKEGFLDTIRKQYADEIHEAYLECSHDHGDVDHTRLSGMLKKLRNAAKSEGLSNKDFDDLVTSTLPDGREKSVA